MATSSGPIFSGQSSYSADFQQVLTRAVAIASLPIQAMQSRVATLAAQQQALSGLQSQFGNLETALQAIASATQGNVTATSSQSTSAAASVTSDALPGTYLVEVDNVGSSTTTLSKATLNKVTDPTAGDITSSQSFTLTLNNNPPRTITMTGSSLVSLANAINAAGAGVTATILNVGSNSSPDYRLALTSNTLGPDTIQLNDGTTDLLDTVTPGTLATYKVNGSATQLTSTSSEVTLSPGLTVRLLAPTTGPPATITVASNYSGLQSALSNFATAFNSAVDTVNQQIGQNAGVLAGQSTVYALSNMLHNISLYTGSSGSVGSLTGLGLNLDQHGHLSFDATAFSDADPAAVQQFLGSVASGGFLQSANNAISSADDTTTGLINTQAHALGDQITGMNDKITQTQTRINDVTANLQAQLTAADAAIATLQAQKSYFINLFAATYLPNANGVSLG